MRRTNMWPLSLLAPFLGLVCPGLCLGQSATHFSPTSALGIWKNAYATHINPANVPIGKDYYFDVSYCIPTSPPVPCTDGQGNNYDITGPGVMLAGKSETGEYKSSIGGYEWHGNCGYCGSVPNDWNYANGPPTFHIPSNFSPGPRYVKLRLVGPGSSQYGETAPVLLNLTVPDTIDLGVKQFDLLNEESICVGQDATFKFKIYNWGELPAYSPHAKLVVASTKDMANFIELGDWALNTTIAAGETAGIPFQFTVNIPESVYGMKFFRVVVYDSSGMELLPPNTVAPNSSAADKCSLQPDFDFVGDGLVWDLPVEDAPVPLYSEQVFKFKFTFQNLGRGATQPDSKVILEIGKGGTTWSTLKEFPFPQSLACHAAPQTSPQYEWRLSSDPASPYYYPDFVLNKTRAIRLRFVEANGVAETKNLNSQSKSKKIKLVAKPTVGLSLQRGAWLPEGRAWGQPDYTTIPLGDPNGVKVRTPGNAIQVTATVTGSNRRIRFFLTGVSAAPGICMNYGSSTDFFHTSPDLQFIQSASPVVNSPQIFKAPGADGFSIFTKNKVSQAVVTVTCYDYGAFGSIGAQVVDDADNPIGQDAQNPDGIVAAPKTLPKDDNQNQISDDFYGDVTKDAAGTIVDQSAAFDAENDMGVAAKPGDGLTRFEEYRGFMMNSTAFARMSPFIKEVFVCRENTAFPIGMFTDAISCIDVNSLQMNGAAVDGTAGAVIPGIGPRVINFNSDVVPGHHLVNQHGLWLKVMLQNNPSHVDDWGIALAGDEQATTIKPFGPPKQHGIIHVHADNIAKCSKQGAQGVTTWWWDATGGSPSTKDKIIDQITAHECGHGIAIQHHLDFTSDAVYTIHVLDYPPESTVTYMELTGATASWYHDRHWEMGVVDCVMRYPFFEIEAAIAGDQNMNGDALQSGESKDTDWIPTVPLVDPAVVYCTGEADELPKIGNPSNVYPNGSNDNCLGQIIISDNW